MEQEIDYLNQLQQKCDYLQQNGKYIECIDVMEEITALKMENYGEASVEYQRSSEKLCELLNVASMLFLSKEKYELSLEFLRKAEQLCTSSLKSKATTFNNLACFYRKTGKIRTALNYLANALDIEKKLDDQKAIGDTHLNLCAVLSQLDRHDEALQHSLFSIINIQEELLIQALRQCRKQGSINMSGYALNEDRLAVLGIAYHNLAVEYEHLKKIDDSVKTYNRAYNFCQENLGNCHSLTQNLAKVLDQITSTQQVDLLNVRPKSQHYNKRPQSREVSLRNENQRDVNTSLGYCRTTKYQRQIPKPSQSLIPFPSKPQSRMQRTLSNNENSVPRQNNNLNNNNSQELQNYIKEKSFDQPMHNFDNFEVFNQQSHDVVNYKKQQKLNKVQVQTPLQAQNQMFYQYSQENNQSFQQNNSQANGQSNRIPNHMNNHQQQVLQQKQQQQQQQFKQMNNFINYNYEQPKQPKQIIINNSGQVNAKIYQQSDQQMKSNNMMQEDLSMEVYHQDL